jgi:hypothetical protein
MPKLIRGHHAGLRHRPEKMLLAAGEGFKQQTAEKNPHHETQINDGVAEREAKPRENATRSGPSKGKFGVARGRREYGRAIRFQNRGSAWLIIFRREDPRGVPVRGERFRSRLTGRHREDQTESRLQIAIIVALLWEATNGPPLSYSLASLLSPGLPN